jgi:hypothetical protein
MHKTKITNLGYNLTMHWIVVSKILIDLLKYAKKLVCTFLRPYTDSEIPNGAQVPSSILFFKIEYIVVKIKKYRKKSGS